MEYFLRSRPKLSPLQIPILSLMDDLSEKLKMLSEEDFQQDGPVVNLAVYKLKKSLQNEGFELVTDDSGKLKLVLRMSR